VRLLIRHLDEGRGRLVEKHSYLKHPHPASVFLERTHSAPEQLLSVLREGARVYGGLRALREGEAWERHQAAYLEACAAVRTVQTALNLSIAVLFNDLRTLPSIGLTAETSHLTSEQRVFLSNARAELGELTDRFLAKADKLMATCQATTLRSTASSRASN